MKTAENYVGILQYRWNSAGGGATPPLYLKNANGEIAVMVNHDAYPDFADWTREAVLAKDMAHRGLIFKDAPAAADGILLTGTPTYIISTFNYFSHTIWFNALAIESKNDFEILRQKAEAERELLRKGKGRIRVYPSPDFQVYPNTERLRTMQTERDVTALLSRL